VALADRGDPMPGALEKQLEGVGVRAQKELILLHREDGPKPRATVDWLRARDWSASSTFHLLMKLTCYVIYVIKQWYIIGTHTHTFNGPFFGTTRVSRY